MELLIAKNNALKVKNDELKAEIETLQGEIVLINEQLTEVMEVNASQANTITHESQIISQKVKRLCVGVFRMK